MSSFEQSVLEGVSCFQTGTIYLDRQDSHKNNCVSRPGIQVQMHMRARLVVPVSDLGQVGSETASVKELLLIYSR